MLEPEPDSAAPPARRALFLLAALAATAALVGLVLLLGSWGYAYRRFSIHVARLERLLEKRPTLEQVTAGLAAEGSPLLAAPRGPTELEAELARWPHAAEKRREILDKAARWPTTRVHAAGDMLYVLYFDAAGVLRDFTCASR